MGESNIDKILKIEVGDVFKEAIDKLEKCKITEPILYNLKDFINKTEIFKKDIPFYVEQLVNEPVEETIEVPTKEPVIIEKVEIPIENKMDIDELKNKINTLEKVVSEIQGIIEGEQE